MYICCMTWFNYNGKLFKENTPVLSVQNRGLRYGDGLFETMKLKNEQLILADEHFSRLWKGLQLLQFDLSRHFTPEKLTAEITALAKKNQLQQAARVRLTIMRGNGGLYDAANHSPNYCIETMPLPNDNETLNSNGLILGIYEAAKKSCDAFCNVKHNNFLPYVMGALHAKKEKWNDALLLNTMGRICDTTIANIFLVKDNSIYTPSLSEGCVAGIMRQQLLAQLKTAGTGCHQKEITPEELLEADEVFLTNSIYNLRWVQRIGNKEYGNTAAQKIYSLLLPTIS
jgi:branched-chain amino acid aminotransferase